MKGLWQKAAALIKKTGKEVRGRFRGKVQEFEGDKLIKETQEKAKEGLDKLQKISQRTIDSSAKGLSQLGKASSGWLKSAAEQGKARLSELQRAAKEQKGKKVEQTKEQQSATQTSRVNEFPENSAKQVQPESATKKQSEGRPKLQAPVLRSAWWNWGNFWGPISKRLPQWKMPKLPQLNIPRPTLPQLKLPKLTLPKFTLPKISFPSISTQFINKAKGAFGRLSSWLLWAFFVFGMGYALGTSIPRQLRRYFEYRSSRPKQQPIPAGSTANPSEGASTSAAGESS